METGIKWKETTKTEKVEFPFQELVGCLMYLVVSTRPHIGYVTNCLARCVTCTGSDHVAAGKRVLRYLQGTKHYGVTLGQFSDTLIEGYCDANYGNCEQSIRSTTGYVFTCYKV